MTSKAAHVVLLQLGDVAQVVDTTILARKASRATSFCAARVLLGIRQGELEELESFLDPQVSPLR